MRQERHLLESAAEVQAHPNPVRGDPPDLGLQ